jgi:hypothetical protein
MPGRQYFVTGGKQRPVAANGINQYALVGVRVAVAGKAVLVPKIHADRLEYIAVARFFGIEFDVYALVGLDAHSQLVGVFIGTGKTNANVSMLIG